jgi:hypothetical protein
VKTETFLTLSRTIACNARTYKSKRACELALARVKSAWFKNGSYGNLRHCLDDAIAAIQARWVELDCDEYCARLREAGFNEDGTPLES